MQNRTAVLQGIIPPEISLRICNGSQIVRHLARCSKYSTTPLTPTVCDELVGRLGTVAMTATAKGADSMRATLMAHRPLAHGPVIETAQARNLPLVISRPMSYNAVTRGSFNADLSFPQQLQPPFGSGYNAKCASTDDGQRECRPRQLNVSVMGTLRHRIFPWYGMATGMATGIALLPILPIDSTLPIILCPPPPSSPNVSANTCVLTIKTPRIWTDQTQFSLHELSLT